MEENELVLDPKVKSAIDEIQKSIKASQEKLRGELEKVSEEKAMDLIANYKKEAGEYNVELDKKLGELQDHLDNLDRKTQAIKDGDLSKKSVKEQLKLSLKENFVDKSEQLTKSGAQGEMNFKVVGDMSSGNITTAITNEYVPGFLEAGVNRVAKRPTFIQSLINTGTIANTRTVTWYEQTTTEGGVAVRAEGATMAQVDYDWERKEETLKIISGYVKVTNEALSDLSWLMSEIEFELFRDMELSLDNQLYKGDGTGNNLNGIDTQSTTFAAGGLALAVDNANEFDVLRVAINQIVLNHFFPTVILLHPDDATKMDLTKATDNQYVLPPFTTSNGQIIKGVPVVENTNVTAGNFNVMDGSRATAFFRENLNLRVWDQNENDPLFNRKTITANVEALLRIKGNDTGAFVNGVFPTAKTALETV